MLDKEKILKEQRVAEAMDKNYMGLDGKFGVILKALGKPIISQGSANYEVTEWPDIYELQDENTLPEEDPDAPIYEAGKHFDGLKFGYHIEISYMKHGTVPEENQKEYRTIYHQAEKVMKVSWKGYLVYLEAEGDLYIFTPHAEWENVVQKVYESACKVYKQKKKELIVEGKLEDMQEKLSFLERLRRAWGI